MKKELVVSAPGRICLFGEHQDYFGLPIVAAAINLRITIRGTSRKDPRIHIRLPDIEEEDEFPIGGHIPYVKKRDYLRSAVNVLSRKGVRFRSGWDCELRGTIPINAGTSSSSALVVAWIKFLLEASGPGPLNTPEEIAELGFLAEVAEFQEPGGKMDHYASALGGIVAVSFDDGLHVERLPNPLKTFVLADSLQKKDTTGMLAYIKTHVLEGVRKIQKTHPEFNLKRPLDEDIEERIRRLPPNERRLLSGTLKTRDLTVMGRALFRSPEFDHTRFGELLSLQQDVLREYLRTSTPKIDRMIEGALEAGALGAKINGSGGGGCVFAYAPENPEEVAEALRRTGAEAHIVRVDGGARVEPPARQMSVEGS